MQTLLQAEVTITLNYGVPAAVEWADAFVFPPEVWDRDRASLFRHDMSLESLLFEFATGQLSVTEISVAIAGRSSMSEVPGPSGIGTG